MKLTKFQIEDDKIFQGFSDGSTWNGWSNPYFTLEVAKEVLNYYQNQSCVESREQWKEFKLEVDKTFMGIDLLSLEREVISFLYSFVALFNSL